MRSLLLLLLLLLRRSDRFPWLCVVVCGGCSCGCRCLALALHNLGVEQECLGDYESAKRTFDRSKDIVRQALDSSTGVDILASVSRVSRVRPRSPGARPTSPNVVLRPPSVSHSFVSSVNKPTHPSHPLNGGGRRDTIGLNKIERRLHRQMLGRRVMDSAYDGSRGERGSQLKLRMEDTTMNKQGAMFTSTTKAMDSHHLNMD